MSRSPIETFFNIPQVDSSKDANITVIGVPSDAPSSYRRGVDPDMVRLSTSGALFNSFSANLINLALKWRLYDAGNVTAPMIDKGRVNFSQTLEQLEAILSSHHSSMKYIFLGGDQLTTYLALKAFNNSGYKKWGLLHLSAFPCLYNEYGGDPYSHCCTVRRVIDEKLAAPKHILQIGLRVFTPDQSEYAFLNEVKGITTDAIASEKHSPTEWVERIHEFFVPYVENIFLSMSMDVLDPAFAPGVGSPAPGGLSTIQVLRILRKLDLPIKALDLTEIFPRYDISKNTQLAAAAMLKEVLARI